MTGLVRTVLGDVDPDHLGVTYCHEHLIIDSPLIAARFPEIHLDSVEAAVSEVTACRTVGVGAMVDAMPSGQGRDAGRLAEIARRTGVHVLACTGLHTEKYYDGVGWATSDPAEALAELFVSEIMDGADGTVNRCGVIKVATGPTGMDDRARRVFEAAAEAHNRTGAPILTHCEEGRGAAEQIQLLSRLSVRLARVAISHTDKVRDLSYHRELLETGVSLEYDQGLRQAPDEGRGTAWLIAELIGEYTWQLMIGTDGARRTLWTSLGGSPGLAWLLTGFVHGLEAWGVGPELQQRLLIDNPKRWLTFG